MGILRALFSTEPALLVGLVTATVAVLVALNVPITDAQRQSFAALAVAVVAVVQAVLTRRAVYSPASYHRAVADVSADPVTADPTPTAAE